MQNGALVKPSKISLTFAFCRSEDTARADPVWRYPGEEGVGNLEREGVDQQDLRVVSVTHQLHVLPITELVCL